MKKTTLTILLCAALMLGACNTTPNSDDTTDTKDSGIGDTTIDTSDTDIVPSQTYTLPDDFVFPITDGSTSTINLDKAVREAILGGEQTVSHSKTYTAFNNLLDGKCELIFTTPLSESQLERMEREGFKHEAKPVAGEGFVFVVNKDNPVDTLTIEQLKGIYSGEITNWSEVGGRDAEIIAYQRNSDSGSQNYMISFMGNTPLMKPVTDIIPATMSGILDVVANYDNGIDAIGYSVYAYSDGMYENMSEIKYIKVNGVEPSLEAFADGSYPLLGYNYAVFSANLPEDSNVRQLVNWIQSDEGQQVIANAGYVPYRKVEGLTLPEPKARVLYTAMATSGIAQPEKAADYYYKCNKLPDALTSPEMKEAVDAFIAEAKAELSNIDKAKKEEFLKSRDAHEMWGGIYTQTTMKNGYLSVIVGICYDLGFQDCPTYYYDVRTAVFDIYTGKKLELSDLFFEDVDFVPLLNAHLADAAVTPFSGFGTTHDMIRDFTGLYEGEFTFTADSIIFKPGIYFADGVRLSLDELSEYMVTSIPRDMIGYVDANIPVYKDILITRGTKACYAEEKNDISILYLDKEKTVVSAEVCNKINAFIDNTYETYFTDEKLLEIAQSKGFDAESVMVGPWPDFQINIVGDRYIEFHGANTGFANTDEFKIIEGHYNPYYFTYFFDVHTGEALRMDVLFSDGWEEHTVYYVFDDYFKSWGEGTSKEYAGTPDADSCQIKYIENYTSARNRYGDLRDIQAPALIYLTAENGDQIVAAVPSEFIKGDPYEHWYTFVYDGKKYDLSKLFPGVNGVGEWAHIGKYVVSVGHVNPHNSAFAVINTETKKIEHHFGGSAPTYHSDDINTIVYAFWNNVCALDGTVLATLELAEGEYIRELKYTDDFQKIEAMVVSESDERTVLVEVQEKTAL